ncbi:MAG: YhbY family RNA-binding protein [Candidatus Methanomethylicia archaeon]
MVRLNSKGLELKKLKIHQSRGDINIGRRGVTDNLISEVKKHLKTHKCLKIKVLKSAREFISDDDIQNIAKAVSAAIIDRRGFTYILIDKKYIVS